MPEELPIVPIVQAVAAGKLKTSGRNKPLEIECSTNSGLVSYVVKLYGNLDLGHHQLVREIYGTLLAHFFGIATPAISIVDIPHDFYTVQPDPEIQAMLQRSPGLNFGSKALTGVPIFQPSVQSDLISDAMQIFCFDMLTRNPDRCTERPNMFQTSSNLIVFDHELAFPFSQPQMFRPFGLPEPWDFNEPWVKKHVLYADLKKHGMTGDIDSFVSELDMLSNDFLATIEEQIPVDWRTEELGNISAYLIEARNNGNQFKRSLQEILV